MRDVHDEVCERWIDIVGENMAHEVVVGSFDPVGNVLELHCEPKLMFETQLMDRFLIEKINGFLGRVAVEKITFKPV